MKSKRLLTAIVVAGAFLGTVTACSQNNSAQDPEALATTKKHHKVRNKTNKRNNGKTKKTVKSNRDQITDQDVIGVWRNHINEDIHQQITFHADHTWNENQHGVTNIYHGTWKITGKRTINLQPWDEDIVFTKGNFKRMTVVSFNHVLTKEK